jgi:hypothetical protein
MKMVTSWRLWRNHRGIEVREADRFLLAIFMNAFFILIAFGCVSIATANDTVWTGSANNEFFNPANWTDGAPNSADSVAVMDGGANLPAIIPAGTGTIEIGAIQLGRDDSFGHVIQNGGLLDIRGDVLGIESAIGDFGSEPSRWIMNNDATIFYDVPLVDGGGFDTDGAAGLDFDIGKSTFEDAVSVFEMHDNSVLRVADDLKIADGSAGHAEFLMTGNAVATIGSGISASGVSTMRVSGNAMLVTGNSAGPGDTQAGRTNEGYLTLSTGAGGEALVEVSENGKIYARTLQQRGGVSTIELRDNGEFHVFDVFEHALPNPGQATVTGLAQGPQRTSHIGSREGTEMYVRLFGNSTMTFDADLEDSLWSGLAVSGGNNRGAADSGGLTEIEVHDSATFIVAQDLSLTLGANETAESILRVRGPDATVNVGGDLRMALTELGDESAGTATLEAIITGNAHSTVTVGGTALIGNGQLRVAFDGYTPVGGETYTLLSAADINGSQFLNAALPVLPEGLDWVLSIDDTQVQLSISSPNPRGDFNGDGILDAADIDALSEAARAGQNPAMFDLTGDGLVDQADRQTWVDDLKRTYFGDANLDGEFNSGDLVFVFQAGQYEDAVEGNSTWATGDWDGDGDFTSSDFVTAFSAGGYEQGPRAAVASVPEPATAAMALLGLAALVLRRRRR